MYNTFACAQVNSMGQLRAGNVNENVNDENEVTPSMPPRKKRKLVESSGEDNDIFFPPPRSSPKTFAVYDSISK